MEATILRSEVLRQMDSGLPFQLEYVTADRRRGTGGQLIKVEAWQKIVGELATEAKPGQFQKVGNLQPVTGKNPNHRLNKTINIFNPNNKQQHPTTVHIKLMQFFNGKRIING